MLVIGFYLVTLASSLALGVWSYLLLKDYQNRGEGLAEGKKSLYVYLVFSICGVALSVILIVAWMFQ